MMPAFHDRPHAGRVLAPWLRDYANRPEVIVVALPRGGVPVAHEVAHRLGAPLEVFVVRKLGLPGHEELAMGAVASGGVVIRYEPVLAMHAVTAAQFDAVLQREQAELARRERTYNAGRPRVSLADRIVVLVDDGIATGATMRAAVQAVRHEHPQRIVVATPVAARSSLEDLSEVADLVIAVLRPPQLNAIGEFYADFRQTRDDEVRTLLATTGPARQAAQFSFTAQP